jgi:hypothetical protein
MQNVNELLDIISSLTKEKRISPNQFKGELEKKEKTNRNITNIACMAVFLFIIVGNILVR